jgi:hypothetical protein
MNSLKVGPPTPIARPAEIINFEAEIAKRRQTHTAAQHAADVLAEFYAGRAPFRAVLAALIAPFASEACDDQD